jgi:hypothetical protein
VVAFEGVSAPMGWPPPETPQLPPVGAVVVALRPNSAGLPVKFAHPPAVRLAACVLHVFTFMSLWSVMVAPHVLPVGAPQVHMLQARVSIVSS